tara:strand:+ start:6172 stop:6699 length:528 start_codon:yes stop_codon:yes gene_type:complete
MSDKLIASLNIDPIVSIAGTSDGDATDAIHHDVGKALNSRFTVNFSDIDAIGGTGKWWYNNDYTLLGGSPFFNPSTDNIGGSITPSYTDGTAVDSSGTSTAKMCYVWIHHKGVDTTGAAVSHHIEVWNLFSSYIEPGETSFLMYGHSGARHDLWKIRCMTSDVKIEMLAVMRHNP